MKFSTPIRGILSTVPLSPLTEEGEDNQLGQFLTIPGNSFSEVDLTVSPGDFRQDNPRNAFPGDGFDPCRDFPLGFDVRIRAIPRGGQVSDATPANNSVIESVRLGGGSNFHFMGRNVETDFQTGDDLITFTMRGTIISAGCENRSNLFISSQSTPVTVQLELGGTPIGIPLPLTVVSSDTDYVVTAEVPAGFPSGWYELRARLMSPNTSPESNLSPAGDVYYVPGPLLLPDLVKASDPYLPRAILPGASGGTSVNFPIRNSGTAAATAFRVAVYASLDDVYDDGYAPGGPDILLGEAVMGSLGVGETRNLPIHLQGNVGTGAEGDYRIFWDIDSGNEVSELINYNNLTLEEDSVWIGTANDLRQGLPALALSSDAVEVGASLSVSGGRINRGSALAAPHRNAIVASSTPALGSDYIVLSERSFGANDCPPEANFPVNETFTIPLTFLGTGNQGTTSSLYYLFYYFDIGNEVLEINEGNNIVALGTLQIFPSGPSNTPEIRYFESAVGEIVGPLPFVLSFTSRSDRNYQIKSSNDLITWTNFGPLLPGQTPFMETYLNDTSPPQHRFFRIVETVPSN